MSVAAPGIDDDVFGDSARARAALAAVVKDKRVIVCVGSGGVGKTTTAAAIGLAAAAAGRHRAAGHHRAASGRAGRYHGRDDCSQDQ